MKLFVFCVTHAMPAAIAMTEEGDVIAQHGGSDAGDAIYWLFYHRPQLEKNYEVVIVDQKLIEQHLYKGASIETLPKDFVAAFRENQRKGKEANSEKLLS